jgi:hypothetical protein
MTEIRTGKKSLPLNSYVLVDMFDGTLKGSPGQIIGSARTKKGFDIFLVQMLDTEQASRGKQEGIAQIQHGKDWVLSLYPEELTPTTKDAAENAVRQSKARPEAEAQRSHARR